MKEIEDGYPESHAHEGGNLFDELVDLHHEVVAGVPECTQIKTVDERERSYTDCGHNNHYNPRNEVYGGGEVCEKEDSPDELKGDVDNPDVACHDAASKDGTQVGQYEVVDV